MAVPGFVVATGMVAMPIMMTAMPVPAMFARVMTRVVAAVVAVPDSNDEAGTSRGHRAACGKCYGKYAGDNNRVLGDLVHLWPPQ